MTSRLRRVETDAVTPSPSAPRGANSQDMQAHEQQTQGRAYSVSIGAALVWTVLYILCTLLYGMLVMAPFWPTQFLPDILALSIVGAALAAIGTLAVFCAVSGWHFAQSLMLKREQLCWTCLAIIGAVAIFFCGRVLAGLVHYGEPLGLAVSLAQQPGPTLSIILMSAGLAVSHGLLFLGGILEGMLNKRVAGAGIYAWVFLSVAQLCLIPLAPAILGSAILCFVYRRIRNLWPCIGFATVYTMLMVSSGR